MSIRLLFDGRARGIIAIVLVGTFLMFRIEDSSAEPRDISYPYVQDDIAGVLLRGIISDLDTYHAVRDFAELVRRSAERQPENRFPMLLLSIGPDAIVGDLANKDYLSVFPTNVPDMLANVQLEVDECNVELLELSNGQTLLWVAVDSGLNQGMGGVRFAEHCILAAVALSLGTDLLDLSGITTNDVISLILAEIE